MIRKVIAGGQTGVDRAGLDAAFDAGIPIGGYCPRGRHAEDGTNRGCHLKLLDLYIHPIAYPNIRPYLYKIDKNGSYIEIMAIIFLMHII